jgi:hypothetical protein
MRKFIKNLTLFFIIALIAGEIIVRMTHAVSDLPQRTIDEFGIQKYYPNQSGYWKGGEHKWVINELGWPGVLPRAYNNLITVIGDSYIENFMNPNDCHQAVLLKKQFPNYNFLEAGRSGVSLIEAMEISKQLDTLRPVYHLIYVNNNDFTESITNIQRLPDITQLNIKKGEIIYGKMKSPGIKKILYNWKLLYYFYNRFPLNLSTPLDKLKKKEDKPEDKFINSNNNEIQRLMVYIKQHYNTDNKILVFHPGTENTIIEICENAGFKVIKLNSENDKTWSFEHDSHWTCYGHNQVAIQVSNYIKNSL